MLGNFVAMQICKSSYFERFLSGTGDADLCKQQINQIHVKNTYVYHLSCKPIFVPLMEAKQFLVGSLNVRECINSFNFFLFQLFSPIFLYLIRFPYAILDLLII